MITEYFEKGTVPTQTCDIHVAVEVCKTSDKLATKNCPANKKQRKIYIVRKKGSHGKTADTPYLLPKKYQSVFLQETLTVDLLYFYIKKGFSQIRIPFFSLFHTPAFIF